MKTLIAALTLATLVIAPLCSARRTPRPAPRARRAAATKLGRHLPAGYPLSEWYRTDGW
jgi:hypothetical protein